MSYLNASSAALILDISHYRMSMMLNSGQVEGAFRSRPGATWRIPPESIEYYRLLSTASEGPAQEEVPAGEKALPWAGEQGAPVAIDITPLDLFKQLTTQEVTVLDCNGEPSSDVELLGPEPDVEVVQPSLRELIAFEGWGVPVIALDGGEIWLVPHVAFAMGYAPTSLAGLIRRDWALHFPEGSHKRKFTGDELRSLRLLVDEAVVFYTTASIEPIHPFTSHIWGLTRPGMVMLLTLTKKPQGIAFRKLLSEDVIPELAETGTYTMPDVEPAPSVQTPPDAHRLEDTRRERIATRIRREYDLAEHMGMLTAPLLDAIERDLQNLVGVAVCLPGEPRGIISSREWLKEQLGHRVSLEDSQEFGRIASDLYRKAHGTRPTKFYKMSDAGMRQDDGSRSRTTRKENKFILPDDLEVLQKALVLWKEIVSRRQGHLF